MAKKKSKQKSASKAPTAAIAEIVQSEVVAEVRSTVTPPALMKLCRLCEAKDGPFLDIFGIEQAIAKKIDNLLPFTVTEYDELPHKICFRCSAKVEELHDFVQRCVKTQENLMTQLGKKEGLTLKTNTRKLWEEKLTRSNMSNDAICDALVQKAMAGITVTDLKPLPLEEMLPINRKRELEKSDTNMETEIPVKKSMKIVNNNGGVETPITSDSDNSVKDNKNKEKVEKRLSRSESLKKLKVKEISKEESPIKPKHEASDAETSENEKNIPVPKLIKKPKEPEKKQTLEPPTPPTPPAQPEQPFNIMDHISTIKVNGVGVLFQCKLCNRNFLKKEVVESHGCAKTGTPKHDFTQSLVTVEPPRNPMANVKYINNKPLKPEPEVKPEPPKPEPPKPEPTPVKIDKPEPPAKPKPKAGPASRTKRNNIPIDDFPSVGMRVIPREPTPPPSPSIPSLPAAIEVPAIPGLKNRYRLLPGPNNTFTLVEDSDSSKAKRNSNDNVEPPPPPTEVSKPGPLRKKEYQNKIKGRNIPVTINNDVIDLDDDKITSDMPYPVGLFQAVSNTVSRPVTKPPVPTPAPAPFTSPAVKKQSYTVVQTGNPSKLLISTKPRPTPAVEPPKPKSKRKSKHEVIPEYPPAPNEPFNVTIEHTAPPKDAFFTFINVDPLLQPSYVLPTDNIIQESQISTSSAAMAGGSKPKDVYTCSLCPETFSREKRLLAHLQAHYDKMDQESKSLSEKSSKKRTRR